MWDKAVVASVKVQFQYSCGWGVLRKTTKPLMIICVPTGIRIGKCMAKLYLHLIKHHAVKTYEGVDIIFLHT
jgi:hypothetical protein